MPKKICVIGAGAAGLVTAKHAIKQGHEVDIFEQTARLGGTWVYSEETGCHSSMYKVLKTNLPKEAMLFQNEPFRKDLPSFMNHEDVLEYLDEYSKDLIIQYNTTVKEVKKDQDLWKVVIESNSNKSVHFYDAIFVCTGNFFEPLNPYENSEFRGEIIHSHDYRRAEHFKGKKVVIIGAGPSGIDITLQVSETASHVTLISKKATYEVLPKTIKQIATHVKSVDENGAITEEGEHIQAEVIIVCTGYVFKFPFLDSSIIQLKHSNFVVSPLYQHICHVDYPTTFFFVGLLVGTITFPLFEVQAKYALSLISGKGKLPSNEEKIRNFEKERLQSLESPTKYHNLVEGQWEYMDKLAEMGDFEKWDYMETIKNLYCYIMTERKKNPIGYKKVNFELIPDTNDFNVIPI